MLYGKFRQKHIINGEKDLLTNGGVYLRLEQVRELRERLDQCRLLVGHFPYVAKDMLPPDVNTMIFLRDPLERAISNIRHIQRMSHSNKTMAQLLELPGNLEDITTNVQTRMLSFKSIDEAVKLLHQMNPDRSRLELAKENLEKTHFIGITEQFSQSIKLCEKTFGWRFLRTRKENVAPEIDEDLKFVRERIQDRIQFDIELYELAKKLFAEKLAKAML